MPLITGKTKLLGIIGDPVEHSLSPVIHNVAIAELGLDYIYVPSPVMHNVAIAELCMTIYMFLFLSKRVI